MLSTTQTYDNGTLLADYTLTRQASLALSDMLVNEDFGLQAMTEVSPPKWHLAHTTWFFETFILKPFAPKYRVFHPQFEYLFNSYYNGVGAQFPRSRRNLLSRPTVEDVFNYRKHVDAAMEPLLAMYDHKERAVISQRCELGIHHEQQHQELFCTDIKYCFSLNPLYPALGRDNTPVVTTGLPKLVFLEIDAMDTTVGYQGEDFYFDNEVPAHQFHQSGFRFANRLVTNEYLEFMHSGGYDTAAYWLSDGWVWQQSTQACQPLYWTQQEGKWFEYTLHGLIELDPYLPVAHVNYYEADAFARWSGKRLPLEQEWEIACQYFKQVPEPKAITLHPRPLVGNKEIYHMFHQLWQWTSSNYSPYPGYRPSAGAIGEYNGKFMCNQMVMRGSSCVTPSKHARLTYRNFFYPRDQWQFTGIRLADDQ